MSRKTEQKKGTILILFAVSLTVLLTMLAIVVDLGWMLVAEGQLQDAADASALAAAGQLLDEDIILGVMDQSDDVEEALVFAAEYAAYHHAGNVKLNEISVVCGFIDDPRDLSSPFITEDIPVFNSVKVRIERSNEMNGILGLFWGGLTGLDSVTVAAEAVATLETRITGIPLSETPEPVPPGEDEGGEESEDDESAVNSSSSHVNSGMIVPIVLPENYLRLFYDFDSSMVFNTDNYTASEWWNGDTWGIPDSLDLTKWDIKDWEESYLDFSIGHFAPGLDYYDASGSTVVEGQGDGIPEFLVFLSDMVAPGNFGYIDINSKNLGTSAIADQIVYGVDPDDYEAEFGIQVGDVIPIPFDVGGNTGISASLDKAFEEIIGETRIILMWDGVTEVGTNAEYSISGFIAVKIVGVNIKNDNKNPFGNKYLFSDTERNIVVQLAQGNVAFGQEDGTTPGSDSAEEDESEEPGYETLGTPLSDPGALSNGSLWALSLTR